MRTLVLSLAINWFIAGGWRMRKMPAACAMSRRGVNHCGCCEAAQREVLQGGKRAKRGHEVCRQSLTFAPAA